MQFKVPQFIDIEDKIFGPLTWKQFIYVAGGGGLCFIIYKSIWLPLALPLIAGVAALALSLAFYKINNKPFIFTLQASVRYFIRTKLYIWKESQPGKDNEKKNTIPVVQKGGSNIPKLSGSKLHDISWSLDVLDKKPQ